MDTRGNMTELPQAVVAAIANFGESAANIGPSPRPEYWDERQAALTALEQALLEWAASLSEQRASQETSQIAQVTEMVANDALAASYQTMGQYRSVLLGVLRNHYNVEPAPKEASHG